MDTHLFRSSTQKPGRETEVFSRKGILWDPLASNRRQGPSCELSSAQLGRTAAYCYPQGRSSDHRSAASADKFLNQLPVSTGVFFFFYLSLQDCSFMIRLKSLYHFIVLEKPKSGVQTHGSWERGCNVTSVKPWLGEEV